MSLSEEQIEVLDQGYVKYIEHWGSDERIIESARMSTRKGFLGWGPLKCDKCAPAGVYPTDTLNCKPCNGTGKVSGDEKLLRFLYEHEHMSPFEMAGATFEIKAPIVVFREWHRHRTQSYNEMSGRYTELPDEYYVPSIPRLKEAKQSRKNKQGSEAGFTEAEARSTGEVMAEAYAVARAAYEGLLAKGVAREVARLVLPVAQYSTMRASANLRNWLHFLSLRMDEAAQFEIRQYANVVHDALLQLFPRTMELFDGSGI